MKNKKFIYILSISFVLLFSLFSFYHFKSSNTTPQSKTMYYLGTVNKVTILDSISEKKANKILDGCDDILKTVDNTMNPDIKSSDVSNINKNTSNSFVKVSKDTFFVINKALKYSNLSNGHFDITIGPLVNLWHIGRSDARVPTEREIDKTIKLINYKNVLLDSKNNAVMLKDNNMKIDLGGIAKGFSADKICDYLKSQKVSSAIINLGGNIYTLGKKDSNKDYTIGIQDPFNSDGNFIGKINVSNKSIVTSGIYERFLKKDNKIYHHILNPFNGYPYDNNLASVTIVSDKSIDGDALSTTAFSLGLHDGLSLLESIDGVDAIFITKDKDVYTTSHIKSNFKITDSLFKKK